MSVDPAILEEIYDNAIYIVKDLNPIDKGDRYVIDCPECGKREAWIYKQGAMGRIFCNRKDKCTLAQSNGLSLWDYVQRKEGLDQQETLERLAFYTRVYLPSLSDDQIQAMRENRNKKDLLEESHRYFRESLFTEDGAKTLEYLKGRGYTEKDIKTMELGHYPGYANTLKHLVSMGFQVNPIPEVFEYAKRRGEYKVVFPYGDLSGNIKAF